MTTESANPTFYDKDSSSYDAERWRSSGGVYTNKVQQDLVAELTREWKESSVLEIGPGTARFTIPLAERGATMTLLDISRGMLDTAQGNLEEAGVGDQVKDYVEGSIYELPFEDDSFDHAMCLNVFNHLERAGDALKQMARVIRPGSTLLINYANLRSWYWPAARRINARRTAVGQDVYSIWERPGDVRRMIEDAGLELVTRKGVTHAPRAMEKYKLSFLVRMVDAVSRSGPLEGLAATHYCLCRKRDANPTTAG